MSCFTRRGEVMTILVAGPNLREKMPPYFWAHSVNLSRVSDSKCEILGNYSLEMCPLRRYLMKITNDWQSWRPYV